MPEVPSLTGYQVLNLEKEVKELREKTKKDEPNGDSGLMGSGLGGRLMIGGPTYAPSDSILKHSDHHSGGGAPYIANGIPNGGGIMTQPTGFY